MSRPRKKYLITDRSAIAKIKQGGGREAVKYIEDILEDLASCCGIDCCENVIRIDDQTTDNIVEISVDDGALKVDGVDISQAAQDAASVDDPYAADGTETETDMTYDGNTVYRQRIAVQDTSEPAEGADLSFSHGVTGINEIVPIIEGKQTVTVSGSPTTDFIDYNDGVSVNGTDVFIRGFQTRAGALGSGDTIDFEVYVHYTKN